MPAQGEGWDVPKTVRDVVDFHWFKVRPGKSLRVGVLSVKPLWYVGHFQDGRMRKCPGEGCELCRVGLGSQLRYVFGAWDCEAEVCGIMEISKSIAQLIQSWVARNGGFRGMLLEFRKGSSKKQSRTEVNFVEIAEPPVWLKYPAPDLKLCLERTWARQTSGDHDE